MAKTYEPIASHTLSSAAASYEFTSIPGTFTDLRAVIVGSLSANNVRDILYQVNSDTGSNYSYTYLLGTGSATGSGRGASQTFAYVGQLSNTAGNMGMGFVDFMSYSNTNVYKTTISGSASDERVERWVGLWRSTSAITSIKFITGAATNYASGTTFSLFGIKAA